MVQLFFRTFSSWTCTSSLRTAHALPSPSDRKCPILAPDVPLPLATEIFRFPFRASWGVRTPHPSLYSPARGRLSHFVQLCHALIRRHDDPNGWCEPELENPIFSAVSRSWERSESTGPGSCCKCLPVEPTQFDSYYESSDSSHANPRYVQETRTPATCCWCCVQILQQEKRKSAKPCSLHIKLESIRSSPRNSTMPIFWCISALTKSSVFSLLCLR